MKQTTKNAVKVGFGSCVAALVCYLCALWLAPMFKVLALVAGFCAGWLAYEFRNVLKAIPNAARAAWHETKHILGKLWSGMKHTWEELLNIQPELAIAIILAMIIYTFVLFFTDYGTTTHDKDKLNLVRLFGFVVPMNLIFICGLSTFFLPFAWILNMVGWGAFKVALYIPQKFEYNDPKVRYIDYKNLPIKERWKMCMCGIYLGIGRLLYGIGWLLYKAVYWAVAIVFCYLWVGLAYAIWYTGKAIVWALSFAIAFIVNLIITVHKKERLICGIDGALGGMFAWLYLAPTWSTNLADHLVPILCGMALGAAFGMFNYWVIAVKLLKTLPRERLAPAR